MKVNEKIVFKKRDNIYFGLDTISGYTFEMNEIQYSIIMYLKEEKGSIESLILEYTKEYDAPFDVISDDVMESIENLKNAGILI